MLKVCENCVKSDVCGISVSAFGDIDAHIAELTRLYPAFDFEVKCKCRVENTPFVLHRDAERRVDELMDIFNARKGERAV